MNQKDYLMALYDALEGLPPQIRADKLSEYKEYFRAEMEKGRLEEDIIASLGDPVSLANVIKSSYSASFFEGPKKRRRSRRPVFSLAITLIILLFVFSSIGTAAKMFFKGGFSVMNFGIGTKYKVNELKEADLGSATRIEIITSGVDAFLSATNGKEVKAHLEGQVVTTAGQDTVPMLEVTRSGDVVTITQKRQTTWVFGFYTSDVALDISIPESFKGDVIFNGTSGDIKASNLELKNLDIDISSGDVSLGTLSLEENLYAASTSGNMAIDGLKARNAMLKGTSGDKKLLNFEVSGDVEATANSGETTLERIQCGQLKAECTSGNIQAGEIKAKLLMASTHSGNIRISELEGGAIAKATSGNIVVDALTPGSEYDLSASSGNIKLSLAPDTGFILDAGVTSGNIRCDFDLKDRSEGKKSLRGTAGSGEVKITAKTTSGNIQILKR